MQNSKKCSTQSNCNSQEARVLAQDFGFSVRQCTCGKISLQVGPVTLRLEPNALLCLASLLEDAATNLLEEGVSFHQSATQEETNNLSKSSFTMPQQNKKWVH